MKAKPKNHYTVIRYWFTTHNFFANSKEEALALARKDEPDMPTNCFIEATRPEKVIQNSFFVRQK